MWQVLNQLQSDERNFYLQGFLNSATGLDSHV